MRRIQSRHLSTTPPIFDNCYELDLGEAHEHARRHGILVQLAGTGRVSAAVATVHAIHTWDPRVVLVAGTAGGFRDRDVSLGDLLVATSILDYETQRVDGGNTVRWAVFQPDAGLLDLARSVAVPLILGRRPQVHFGPVLSGDKIVASKAAVDALLKLRPDALAVEMEGGGVALAAAMSSVPFLMIRGVVDYADEKKRQDAEQWSKPVCETVALFVRALLESWADHRALGDAQ